MNRRIPDPATAGEKVLQEKVRRVVHLCEDELGEIPWPGPKDPLEGLVVTLLSHNTNDNNRDRAWRALRARYPDWEAVRRAPVEELAGTIRVAGLNRQKAARIQALLGWLKETQGAYTADFLRSMSFDEAVGALGHLKGVGFKTIAVVMAFDLGEDVFPVDTHVHRLCRRLGFVPESYDAVKTFHAMRGRVPEGRGYSFHLHLITHGRNVCRARKPECERCFLRGECLHYDRRVRAEGEG